MTEHEWQTVIKSDTATFETCVKCGLSRLTTLSSVHHFLHWGEPFLQCSSPYVLREGAA